MPTGCDPVPANGHGIDVVELQGNDRCSADRRATGDFQASFAPIEMLIPRLLSGVEQWHKLLSFGIDSIRIDRSCTCCRSGKRARDCLHRRCHLSLWG